MEYETLFQGLELKIKELEKTECKQDNGNVRVKSKRGKSWLHKLDSLTKLTAFIINPALYLGFILFYFTANWDNLKI